MTKEEGSIQRERVGRRGLTVTHLLFANDSILFGKASEEGASAMKATLLEYEGVSGQVINLISHLFFFTRMLIACCMSELGICWVIKFPVIQKSSWVYRHLLGEARRKRSLLSKKGFSSA